MSILAATQAFLRPSAIGGASHVYLRGVASDEIRGLAEERVGLPLSNLALYLSAAGSVTNLHWDSASGVLAQSRGEKDVALFAARSMPQEAGRSSPCFRRSYLSGSAAPQGSAFLLRLTPGWGLFVPARSLCPGLCPLTPSSVSRALPPQLCVQRGLCTVSRRMFGHETAAK